MFKKVISLSILGVSALSIATMANAATSGVYLTGQLGYANTHMGSKTTITDLMPENVDFTPDEGSASNLANNGLAGRIAVGYQFNPNFAVEVGYLQLGSQTVHGSQPDPAKEKGTLPASASLKQNAVDLVGKAMVPIASNVSVYGKLGVAYLNSNINGKGFAKSDGSDHPVDLDLNGQANVSRHTFAPEVALGVNYDVTPNVSVDTSWTHIQTVGKKRPGNIDFVALGVGYHFG